MFALFYFLQIICMPIFAMESTGDVLLKNVYNNNGKIITIAIARGGNVLTQAEFSPDKNVAQSWVNRLQSQKSGNPHSISIKQLGFTHIPTGTIKEFDLIIDSHGVSVIPTGTKNEERAQEDRAFAIKGLMRKATYSTVNVTEVENNSADHAVIIIKDENKKNVDIDIPAKATKMVNLEIAQGKEITIETRYNKNTKLYTYQPDGKFEYLRIIINPQGVAIIAEGAAASPRRVSPRPMR
jgi:predicted small secreted protein